MIPHIDTPSNKERIAIVVVGYNRIKSITRLLNSLLAAVYKQTDVPLVISIDASGDESLYDYVNSFEWPYGEKYVNIQKSRLGLKQHIFQCGELTRYFKAVVLLEDDIFVSPYFYDYIQETVEKYGDHDRIAEISLYKNEWNGYAGLPFENLKNGSDVFLMQDVSTWGQCWTRKMWESFTEWRDSHNEEYIQTVDMPYDIKTWERAWSKYYNAYVVDTNRYVLYPEFALSTNFSDAGEHGSTQNSVVQVNLLQAPVCYRFPQYEELVKYDIYFNNEDVYKWINYSKSELCLDFYGIHENQNKRYILSSLILPYKVLRTYAMYMRPWELNVKYNIEGEGLYLYDTSEALGKIKRGEKNYPNHLYPYIFNKYKKRFICSYSKIILEKLIKMKLRLE